MLSWIDKLPQRNKLHLCGFFYITILPVCWYSIMRLAFALLSLSQSFVRVYQRKLKRRQFSRSAMFLFYISRFNCSHWFGIVPFIKHPSIRSYSLVLKFDFINNLFFQYSSFFKRDASFCSWILTDNSSHFTFIMVFWKCSDSPTIIFHCNCLYYHYNRDLSFKINWSNF